MGEKILELFMADHIDYYYTSTSPFTWFGQKPFEEVAKKHKKKIVYKPAPAVSTS